MTEQPDDWTDEDDEWLDLHEMWLKHEKLREKYSDVTCTEAELDENPPYIAPWWPDKPSRDRMN